MIGILFHAQASPTIEPPILSHIGRTALRSLSVGPPPVTSSAIAVTYIAHFITTQHPHLLSELVKKS